MYTYIYTYIYLSIYRKDATGFIGHRVSTVHRPPTALLDSRLEHRLFFVVLFYRAVVRSPATTCKSKTPCRDQGIVRLEIQVSRAYAVDDCSTPNKECTLIPVV